MNKIRIFTPIFLSAALLVVILTVGSATAQEPGGEGLLGLTGTTNPTTVLYQGYVMVGETPHDGTGYFKFAVVNAAGNTTYWSNDGTSTGGSQPTAAVSRPVSDGYFTVLLGDTSLGGMTQALNPTVFAGAGRYLRVWFATSASGPFTQLSLVPIAAAPYALNAETLDGLDSTSFANASHDHWGETWSGSGTGLTISSTNQALRAHAGGTAIIGFTSSSDPIASTVYGENKGGAGLGVEGYSAAGIGTVGESNTGTGLVGVSGYPPGGFIDESLRDAAVTAQAGVYGWSASGIGGYFESSSNTGAYGGSPTEGVRGYASASSGTTTGGFFASASDAGRGVYGWNFAGTGNTYGVIGDCASSSGTGVFGLASAVTAANTGVYGYAAGIYTNTAGVKGYASATSGNPTWGVYGQSDSDGGAGVMAYNYWNGVGLRAQSYGGNIIEGYSGDPGYDVLRFLVDNVGNLYAGGTKSAVVQTQDYDSRSLYAIESPEVWFEDFGTGQLANGEATVSFDPIFAQTVSLTETYHVFLTPLSDEAVLLFVTDKGPTSFTVRGVTLDGQPASAVFDYRIVAKRLGYEDVRLEPASASIPEVQIQSAPRPESGWPMFPPLPEQPDLPTLPKE